MTQAERKENTREAIENAAIECFYEKSYNVVTMEEIASKSGYTKRTVYNYYPSKANLTASIFERRLEKLYGLVVKALTECHSAKDIINVYFWILHNFTRENYSFMNILWTSVDEIKETDENKQILDNIVKWNGSIIQILAVAIGNYGLTGTLAKYSPYTVVHLMSAINKGLTIQYGKNSSLELMNSVTMEELTGLAFEMLMNSVG
ncbi:MAG: TetR/AcrR family transcriptional regulator [Lachnospiraceae bacterium]|nr:TetR/AcrR family transcriptional regulator [Lachnospiraceae bacterium]